MDLVTIILTTLNSERYLSRSIESCLGQTYRQLELLVVDGGSTDRTLEIVRGYSDSRIRLICQTGNEGKLPGALNLGMAESRGAYITWTQDDSWFEPDAIDTMASYLEQHEETSLVYADFWIVDAKGQHLDYRAAPPPDRERFLWGDVIGQCFLARREVYEIVGPQEVEYFPVHEVPWRIKVVDAFRVEPLNRCLMSYMAHPASLTGRIGRWELSRMTARAVFQAGYVSEPAMERRLAAIDLGEAYEQFVLHADYRAFRRLIRRGVLRDRKLAANPGMWKLLLTSITPFRDRYRERAYEQWSTRRSARQAALISRAGTAGQGSG